MALAGNIYVFYSHTPKKLQHHINHLDFSAFQAVVTAGEKSHGLFLPFP